VAEAYLASRAKLGFPLAEENIRKEALAALEESK
jgi:hypothetical protein